MSDGLNPTGPAQPPLNEAYNTAGNQASKEPAEAAQARSRSTQNAPVQDQRIPTKQTSSMDEATPTSMARGVRGAGPGEDPSTLSDQQMGRSQDVEAEQMGAPGEDKVADAVDSKPGAGGRQPGLETDLDRKKAEQAPLREARKEEKQEELDVGGILGQRGGPANPVDKGGYPNAGS